MAAASAVKGEEPSDSGHGESPNNVPLKTEGNQDILKSVSLSEKQSVMIESGKSLKENNDKAQQAAKKYVDAPLPVTNAWTKRSASLTSAVEPHHTLSYTEPKKEAPVSDKALTQGNAVTHKPSKGGEDQFLIQKQNQKNPRLTNLKLT